MDTSRREFFGLLAAFGIAAQLPAAEEVAKLPPGRALEAKRRKRILISDASSVEDVGDGRVRITARMIKVADRSPFAGFRDSLLGYDAVEVTVNAGKRGCFQFTGAVCSLKVRCPVGGLIEYSAILAPLDVFGAHFEQALDAPFVTVVH